MSSRINVFLLILFGMILTGPRVAAYGVISECTLGDFYRFSYTDSTNKSFEFEFGSKERCEAERENLKKNVVPNKICACEQAMRWKGMLNPLAKGQKTIYTCYLIDADGQMVRAPKKEFYSAKGYKTDFVTCEKYAEDLRKSAPVPPANKAAEASQH